VCLCVCVCVDMCVVGLDYISYPTKVVFRYLLLLLLLLQHPTPVITPLASLLSHDCSLMSPTANTSTANTSNSQHL
jgi:hypothetical protein